MSGCARGLKTQATYTKLPMILTRDELALLLIVLLALAVGYLA
jgi:hypothetical protein